MKTTPMRNTPLRRFVSLSFLLALGCKEHSPDSSCDEQVDTLVWSVVDHSVTLDTSGNMVVTVDVVHPAGLAPRGVWLRGRPMTRVDPADKKLLRYSASVDGSDLSVLNSPADLDCEDLEEPVVTGPCALISVADSCHPFGAEAAGLTAFANLVGEDISVSFPNSESTQAGNVTLLPGAAGRIIRFEAKGLGAFSVTATGAQLVHDAEDTSSPSDGCVVVDEAGYAVGREYSPGGGVQRYELDVDPVECLGSEDELPVSLELFAQRSGKDKTLSVRFVPGPKLDRDTPDPIVAPDPFRFTVSAAEGLTLSSCTLMEAPTGLTVKMGTNPLQVGVATPGTTRTAGFEVSSTTSVDGGDLKLVCQDTLKQEWLGSFPVTGASVELFLDAPSAPVNADGDRSAPAAEPLVLTVASADPATVSLTTGQEALVPYAGGACATDSGKSDLDLTLTASGTGYSGRACLRGDPGIHLVVAEQGRAEAELRVTLTEPPVPTLDLSAPTATLDGGELYASTVEPLVLLVSSDDGGDVHLTTGETALVPVVGGVCSGTPSDEIALSLDPVGTGYAAEVCLDGSAGVHLVLAEQGAASEELRFTLVDPPEFFPTSVALTTGTTVWLTLPASLTASEPMTHLSCYVVGDSAIQVVDTASGTDVVLTASAVSFAAPTALSVSAGVGAVSGDSARLTCTDGLGQSAFVNFTVE